MNNMMQVVNPEGRTFNVRVVTRGMAYGRDDCLTYGTGPRASAWEQERAKVEPMIEFYDATQDPAMFGERGQFVARYQMSSLTEGTYGTPATVGGLALDGGVKVWWVSAQNVREAVALAAGIMAAASPSRASNRPEEV